MRFYGFPPKPRWRKFGRYGKPRFSLAKGFTFLVITVSLIIVFACYRPVKITHQAYSVWEQLFEDGELSFGVKLRWRDGEIEFYKKEKILQE